jgi:hypothetical protein
MLDSVTYISTKFRISRALYLEHLQDCLNSGQTLDDARISAQSYRDSMLALWPKYQAYQIAGE